jgi:hypothetical protein
MEPDWSGVHFTLQRLYWQEAKCIVAAALSISSSKVLRNCSVVDLLFTFFSSALSSAGGNQALCCL